MALIQNKITNLEHNKANNIAQAKFILIDLDGTLVATDTLWESLVLFFKKNPFNLFLMLLWVIKGKSVLKEKISETVIPDVRTLPYRTHILKKLKEHAAAGKKVILATGANYRIAESVAAHIGLFDKVLATNGQINLTGHNKREEIIKLCDGNGYEYWGDSSVDIPIWENARSGIAVNPSGALVKRLKTMENVTILKDEKKKSAFWIWIKALRIHQWSKNMLIFLPLVMAHAYSETGKVFAAALAFLVFSLCASSVYLINDLFDLKNDRKHPVKKHRPLASGQLAIPKALMAAPVLLVIAFSISLFYLPHIFTVILTLYFLTTSVYSFLLKKLPVVDVLLLSGLYTTRILAGSGATAIPVSSWLLAFSIFFFLGLAFMKRYTELMRMEGKKNLLVGRGYTYKDTPFVGIFGITCSLLSIMVFVLYLNSVHVLVQYQYPIILWLIVPLLCLWIMRMWLFAYRRQLNDDPVVFTIKDKTSLLICAMVASVLLLGQYVDNIGFIETLILMPQ